MFLYYFQGGKMFVLLNLTTIDRLQTRVISPIGQPGNKENKYKSNSMVSIVTKQHKGYSVKA